MQIKTALRTICSEIIESNADDYTKAIAQVTLGCHDMDDLINQARLLTFQPLPAKIARVVRRITRKVAS